MKHNILGLFVLSSLFVYILRMLNTNVASARGFENDYEGVLNTCIKIIKNKDNCRSNNSNEILEMAIDFCKNPFSTSASIPKPDNLESIRNSCDNIRSASTSSSINLGSLTGGFQDNLIKGLAAFLESRAKAEAMATLISNIKNIMCGEEKARACLPYTCNLALVSDPYVQPISWGVFKAAFEDDLNHLPERVIENFIEAPVAGSIVVAVYDLLAEFLRNPEEVMLENIVFEFVGTIAEHAGEAKLSENDKLQPEHVMALLVRFMKYRQIIMKAFQEKKYIDKIPLGLMISARLALEAASDKILKRGMKPLEDACKKALEKIKEAVNALETYIKKVKPEFIELKTQRDDPKKWKPILENIVMMTSVGMRDMSHYLTEASYVLLDILKEANTFETGDIDEIKKRLVEINQAIQHVSNSIFYGVSRQYHRLFLEVVCMLNKLLEPEDIPKWLRRFGPFIVEVAQANSSKAVEKAIESAATPLGSFRFKRSQRKFFVTVNGYVGGVYGWEKVSDVDLSLWDRNRYGVFAPVGVEAGYAVHDHFTISAFLSVLDLGGLLAFGDGKKQAMDAENGEPIEKEIKGEPSYKFEQVFSPGAFLVFGLTQWIPMSLGVGGAISPMVHQVKILDPMTENEIRKIDATTFHFSVFLAVDIPIWIF